MKSSQKSISILGCGWLGAPLATALSDHYTLKKSPDFSIRVHEKNITGNLTFFDSDMLIITLPFKRTFEDPWIYPNQITQVLNHTKKNQWILFTSSTSIYPNINKTFTEETVIIPENDRGKALLKTEQLIQNHSPYTIIRLGGLYGPNRELKKDSKSMNLIHLNDAIGLITKIIDSSAQNHIFNAVSNVRFPHEPGKKVDNTKIKNVLGYTFYEAKN
jgi:hypothetical protein